MEANNELASEMQSMVGDPIKEKPGSEEKSKSEEKLAEFGSN